MTVALQVESIGTAVPPRKRRRWRPGPPDGPDTLPTDWRDMAARWLRRSQRAATGCRWESLAGEAGPARYALAQQLLDWLLHAGWVTVFEDRRHGAWWPTRIEFTDAPALRRALGLPDPDAAARRWAELRVEFDADADPDLATIFVGLQDLPPARAADRAELLISLSRWRREQRSGTRRDFAQFARGATKAVSEAEWRWMEAGVDLAACGIERHTPLLLIAAPLELELPGGPVTLDLPDFAACTPATLAGARSIRGNVNRWRLVENRTSFERLARARLDGCAVVWLPGFPPAWWRKAMSGLLRHAPAAGEIACDPDPAGIAIALEAGRAWDDAGLPWGPWCMDAARLAGLPRRLPLTTADRALMDRLTAGGLPAELARLAEWMAAHGEKGEQEGFL